MSICRDCHEVITCGSQPVKYGVRHYLHPLCAIERGEDFLKTLPTWQLESLPALLLKKAGLLHAIKIEIINRQGKGHFSILGAEVLS